MTISQSNKPTVAIIGAGISGICAFIQLVKELDITTTIFELNNNVGGTWLQNTYPGCGCDVPSHLYSLSSELNPDWSKTFSSQQEILEYLQNICKKHQIYQNTRFETEVTRASWINERKQWQLEVKSINSTEIETLYFDFLFSGVGSLRVPKIPTVFKNFEGPVIHTGAWDSFVDYKNKRVALVGSGSSGAQVLPYLANDASKLIFYQRSPPWIFPKSEKDISLLTKIIYAWFPFLMIIYRWFLILYYERNYITLGYPNSSFSKKVGKQVLDGNKNILIESGRSDLIDKLTPTSLNGCRRGVQSSDYYQTLMKPHVSVITEPIKQVKGNRIITEDDGEEELDVLVLATGFKTQEGMLGNIQIIGKEGESLTELWKVNSPQLYKSTMVHGFPNFFMLLGPYSLTGHISLILIVEIQVKYAIRCIKENAVIIEPTQEAQTKYMNKLMSDFQGTAWTSSCSSWYKNESGIITSLYPNTVTRFRWELKQFNKQDYNMLFAK